jgi:hypothetical protein
VDAVRRCDDNLGRRSRAWDDADTHHDDRAAHDADHPTNNHCHDAPAHDSAAQRRIG